MKTLAAVLFAALALPVLSLPVAGQEHQAAAMRMDPWPAKVVELAESLPCQDGGRIKPLHTFASFTLLRLNGKRSMTTPQDEKLSATEWLLDTLFFPEAAADYRVLLVQNSEVIEAIGIDHADKKKRDRYSLNELRSGVNKLYDLAHEYGNIESQDRSSLQHQIVVLAENVNSLLQLLHHMDFARLRLGVDTDEKLSQLFHGETEVTYAEVLEHGTELASLYTRFSANASATEEERQQLRAVTEVLRNASEATEGTHSLALIPPAKPASESEEWMTPADLFAQVFQGQPVSLRHLEVVRGFEGVARNRNQPEVLQEQLATVHAQVEGLAGDRGEYELIPLELTYYKAKLIPRSLYVFVLAFLVMAIMWLVPTNVLLQRATWALVLTGTVMLVAGIVIRCIIRSRPPVSTLYETVLFVTAVGAIIALFMEAINRRRIAISAAAIMGMVGLFIANGYENLDKADTMPSLVAVLDTNFWLSTHVTSITTGYSAGMLAALLANIYLVTKLVRGKKASPGFYRNLSRMVYGVLCFGLIFSLVGTILGGIWANDSWGRFWGWDPKENGALLICISQIAILHGRMGGYLRQHGVCMAAAFGGTIIAFSWWGVNLLGVGLHSYGFTSGVHTALWTYYGLQWGIVGLGGLSWLLERSASRAVAASQVKSPKRIPPVEVPESLHPRGADS